MNLEKILSSIVIVRGPARIVSRSEYAARIDVLNRALNIAHTHIFNTHKEFIDNYLFNATTLKRIYSRLRVLINDDNKLISREASILRDHFIRFQCAYIAIAQLNQTVDRTINYADLW